MESYFMTDAWCFFDALQDSLIDQQKKGFRTSKMQFMKGLGEVF